MWYVLFHRPITRIIPIELQDYLPADINSPEQEAQAKRISHVLESRYLEDSLIPSDPDPVGAKIGFQEEPVALDSNAVEIPWKIPGGNDESTSDVNALDPVSNFFENLLWEIRIYPLIVDVVRKLPNCSDHCRNVSVCWMLTC